MPIVNAQSKVIGVIQVLNKKKGRFTKSDLEMVSAITEQASATRKMPRALRSKL